jgi:predicted Holliday junction resolvase-like endonuclease
VAMNASNAVLLAVTVVLILVFALALLVLMYLRLRSGYDRQVREYVQLQSDLNDRVMRQMDQWRALELEPIKQQLWEAADAELRRRMQEWEEEWETKVRSDALARSGAVVTGQVAEQLAPYMFNFPYNPKDARFIGSPIDMIVFDGMSEGDLRRVIFLEIKTGGSHVNKRQRQIRGILHANQVEWRLLEIGRR